MEGLINNLLATIENNDDDTDFIAFDEEENIIEEAFAELDQEDRFEEELYDESFENILDTIVERGKNITEGKYSLEKAMDFEQGLEHLIDDDTDEEITDIVLNDETEILRLKKVFSVNDELLKAHDVEEEEFEYKAPEEIDDEEGIKVINEFDFKNVDIEDLLYMSFDDDDDDLPEDIEFVDDDVYNEIYDNIYTDSEEKKKEGVVTRSGKWVKGKFIKPKPSRFRRAAGAVGRGIKEFGREMHPRRVISDISSDAKYVGKGIAKGVKGLGRGLKKAGQVTRIIPVEKTPWYKKIFNKVRATIASIKKSSASLGNKINEGKIMKWVKDKAGKLKDMSKRLTRFGKVASIGVAVIAFVSSILLLARSLRRHKVNYDKQSAALNKLSGDFNGDKSARIVSKDELNKMISACKSIMASAKKAASSELTSADEAKAKFNGGDLSTLGISINKRGKAKFGKISRSKQSLSDHGYSAGDFARLKKEHKAIGDMMFSVGESIAGGNPGGGRGARAIVQTTDKAYRITMVNIFAAAKALG